MACCALDNVTGALRQVHSDGAFALRASVNGHIVERKCTLVIKRTFLDFFSLWYASDRAILFLIPLVSWPTVEPEAVPAVPSATRVPDDSDPFTRPICPTVYLPNVSSQEEML